MNQNEINYLERYFVDEVRNIIRVDLLEDTYEVFRIDNKDERLYEIIKTNIYSDAVNMFKDNNYVYLFDVPEYEEKTAISFLKEHFAHNSEKVTFSFRSRFDDGYRWIIMRIIPAENYTSEKPVVYMCVQEDDASQSLEISEAARRQISILSSLASIYMSMHVIDLKADSAFEFSSNSNIKELINSSEDIASKMRNAMTNLVAPEYVEKALEFTDLNTVAERLGSKTVITEELAGINVGWFRAQFVVVERDDEGMPSVIIYTTQNINEEKEKMHNLINISKTDELSGLYNRRAFEYDLISYEEANDSKLTIVSMDINGLKAVNDTLGHIAGDELIKATSKCIMASLVEIGKVYRVGGDEFVAILSADIDKIVDALAGLQQMLSLWQGTYISNITMSYGYATRMEFPNEDLRELIKIADKRMYIAKKRYYDSLEE